MARRAEEALAGRALDDEAIREAAQLAAEDAEPRDDVRGSATYKRNVVRIFTDQRVGAVPVVDETDRVIGIISYVDVFKNAGAL